MNNFEQFWARYPRKVGRLAAQTAYARACRIASHDTIMAGLERYRQQMPRELQYVAHAKTWLNQGRWQDEYEDAAATGTITDWYFECGELHDHACGLNQTLHHTRMLIDAAKVKA